ncbi:hypothetical protein LUZ62_060631 [Rhynchospora pubera]|uniref:Uncharacterized protein n=1 Tax=Rhynchospora pubera TaxID=906938 RepID=A0AAV8E7U7_9POAL|nr:hypothetical protein LUZ62_060631 [Rhynchospora pubera]
MDAANAPSSIAPAPSESSTQREAKEITDEIHTRGTIEEAADHVDRLNVVVDLDLSLRLSKLPMERIFISSSETLLPLMPRESEATDYFFTPRVVSIGPYHHGKSCLAKMERHKSRFLEDFLSRNTSRSFEHYQNELRKILRQRATYSVEYDATKFDLTRDEFVDTIILDGCFILEFLIKFYNHTSDEIFNDETMLRYIKTDLLMFDNQVPMFVLGMLLGDWQNCKGPIATLKELLAYYFWGTKDDMSMYDTNLVPGSLLQLYNQLFILPYSDDGKVKGGYPRGNYWKIYSGNPVGIDYSCMQIQAPSAQQLEKSGALFRAKRSAIFLDINFHDGVLEIPVLSMDEPFLLFFINLATFDLHVDRHFVMGSYCRFMACLLETSTDVAILRKHGIIESKFMTDQNLLDLFHKFGKFDHWMHNRNYFGSLFEDLWYFCARPEKKPYDGLWHFIARINYCIECLWNCFCAVVLVFLIFVLPAILVVFIIFAIIYVLFFYH